MNYSKISRSFLALFTILILITGFMPLGGLVPKAQAATLDPASWEHMRPITIDNSGNANALTDYQVKVDTSDVFYDEDGLVGSWHMNEMSEPDANNVIDPSTWTVGSGSVSGFTRNGDDAENYRIDATDPSEGQEVIWEARPTATSDADGGWNGDLFEIDPTKTYRFSVWVNRTVQGNGSFYLGLNGYDAASGNVGVLKRSDGANNTNPYFWISGTPTVVGTWTLVVAHVWPAGSGTGANYTDSGRYTVAGGKIGDISLDYVWRADNTQARHRSYLYYSTNTSTRQRWAYPRVDVVDGSEPSVQELISGAPTGVINDSSGNNNNGTVMNGVALTTGKYGSALSFNGVNDYVRVSGTSAFQRADGQALTVEAWIKPSRLGGQYQDIIVHRSASYYNWMLYQHTTDGSVQLHGNLQYKSTYIPPIGVWTHIVATVNESGVYTLYANGTVVQTVTGYQYHAATPNELSIGNFGTAEYYQGLIDEAKIYNRALPQTEIQAQYNASDVRLDYGDVRFTDTNGSTLLDYWMEKDGTFWVKVPSVPASSTKTIYMYYGNAGAESVSNYTDTATVSSTSYSYQGDTGLVGEWRMENNWNDTSGSNNNGTAGGGIGFTTSSKFGSYAGNFDGVDDSVTLGDPSSLNITGSQTIEMWLKPASLGARRNPYAKAYGGEGTITQEMNGSLSYYYGTAGANAAPYQGFGSGADTVSVDTWSHVAIVRDLTNMKLKWYKDGQLINEVTASYGAAAASALSAYIGDGYTSNYSGLIDEMRIYNRALSTAEIAAQYLDRQYTSPEPTITINAENYPPSAPVHIYTNNAINPTDITNSSPTLSAEYDDQDASDTASFYEIQIIADGGIWTSPYWDSTKKVCSVSEGDRLQVTYSGTALNLSQTKYYQRWKFWDSSSEGSWSDGTDYFVTATPKNEYNANIRGYAWSDDIGWLSFNNRDNTSFVASYNAGTGALSGWGWSDGIGWISLDCASDDECNPVTADHSVIVDGSGDISGDAWSDNLGWLSFDRTETGNPPGDPYQVSGAIAHYDSSTKEFSGWAKFLSAPEAGWDGWIKLQCYGAECDADGWTDGTGAMSGVFVDDSGYLEGWAWGSDVVGWIGFKGPGDVDYGVTIDEASNKLSGHAWSSNLGWISFDRDETGNPPSDDPCSDESCITRLKEDNYQLDGWARALNYGDGWDGWISLNQKTGDSFAYEVALNTDSKEFEGWAYGSDVLGWISFNHLTDGSSYDYKVYTGLPLGIQPTDPHDTWNLCADALHPTLNWDVSGTTNGYEVEVYSDADLNNLVYSYQAVDTSSVSHYANSDAGVCHLGANGFQNSPDCNLSYLSQYWWRVRARNTDNVWGQWSTIDAFTVTSSHQWPGPNFTTNPESPQLGSVTHLLDQSTTYGGSTAAIWQWILSGTSDTDYQYANSTSSTDQNPDITFLTNTAETITFEVTDSDGYGPCSCGKEATITSGSIQWKEVTPTP